MNYSSPNGDVRRTWPDSAAPFFFRRVAVTARPPTPIPAAETPAAKVTACGPMVTPLPVPLVVLFVEFPGNPVRAICETAVTTIAAGGLGGVMVVIVKR